MALQEYVRALAYFRGGIFHLCTLNCRRAAYCHQVLVLKLLGLTWSGWSSSEKLFEKLHPSAGTILAVIKEVLAAGKELSQGRWISVFAVCYFTWKCWRVEVGAAE